MKTTISITIDVEIAQKAKKKFDNLSKKIEDLLRKEVKIK